MLLSEFVSSPNLRNISFLAFVTRTVTVLLSNVPFAQQRNMLFSKGKTSMKRIIFYFDIVLILSFCGCKSDNPNSISSEYIQYSEILMKCMDLVSIGGKMEVVVNSQTEYDSLIYARFTKPLQDYWNAYYDSTLLYVRQNTPGLSDSEYALLVRNIFYSVLPFKGTDSCSHPSIDFAHYTLLGLDANAGGCKEPDHTIFVSINKVKKEIIYKIVILEHGTCEMGFNRNKWILIPKLPESYRVLFQKEFIQVNR